MIFPWHLYLMSFLYILAGFNHFRSPKMYIRIIPSIFSKLSAWGIILLLIAIFPANLYMLQNEKASFGLPKWLLLFRLPLQLVLIYWAYLYT